MEMKGKYWIRTFTVSGEIWMYTKENKAKLKKIFNVISAEKEKILKNAISKLQKDKIFVLSSESEWEDKKKTQKEIEKIEKVKTEIIKAERIILKFIENTDLKTWKLIKKWK